MAKKEQDVEVMKWDVALANLAAEEYQQKGRSLKLDDFMQLSKQYSIRLDDIMVTMFELVINGVWSYRGEQTISRKTLNELYVGGRLHATDLEVFRGDWFPQK